MCGIVDPMKILKTQTDGIPVIRMLADVAFRHTYRDILSPKQIEYMMDWMYSEESLLRQIVQDGHQFFIASIDDKPVGYVSVSCDEPADGLDVFHLQKLYVLPAYQGQGIGGRLFHTVLDYLNEIHPQPCRLVLNVNRNNKAFGFYKKMGMSILRQGDFPIGNDYYMNDYILYLDRIPLHRCPSSA